MKAFINIFHRLLQENKLDGILVDIAEYTHLPEGPGVLLVAHEGHWVMDTTGGRLGLLYNQKRVPPASAEDHLRRAFTETLKACVLLEAEPEMAGKLKFTAHHVQVTINDRLAAPNTPESYELLEPALRKFLTALYGDTPVTLQRETDPRKRCTVEVTAPVSLDAPKALKRLSNTSP